MNIKMVITDLDGTLLNPDREVSADDLATLHLLGRKGICRVIATGRSVYSLNKVIPDDFPIDYLIFSTGAGIMDWPEKKRIAANQLSADETAQIARYLLENRCDFMIHEPIPENHKFWYHESGPGNPDFLRRVDIYNQYAIPLQADQIPAAACQFVIVLSKHENQHDKLVADLRSYKVIRATSPLDHESVWVEIFPANVSKGHGAEWLCQKLGIAREQVMSIGNDYNDLDLLDWSGQSYVVENAPDELKAKYRVTHPNHRSAFTAAVSENVKI